MFLMFLNVCESELCLNYKRKMLVHIERFEDQDLSLILVEGVLPGVK